MKVTTAIVKLVLWTSKTLANGENPIMLQVSFNGTKRVSTHFSCTPKHWDKKNECIKKGYPNYNGINEAITNAKNKMIAKKLEFERTNTPYNAEMLVETETPKTTITTFHDVMERMFVEKASKYNTKKNYTFVYNRLKNHFGRDNFLVSELTNEKLIEIVNCWKGDLSANTIIDYTRVIRAVIQYAADNGFINSFPHKGFSYIKTHFRNQINHKSLEEFNISKIRNYLIKSLENDKTKLLHKGSMVFAAAFFYCIHKMNGLAPVDAMKLKVQQVTEDGDYYKVETTRSKTAIPVKAFIKRHAIEGHIVEYLLSNSSNDYLFPILNKTHETEEQVMLAIKRQNIEMNRALKEVAKKLDIEKFTLYSARHTFASLKVKEGVNIGTVAKAMARSVAGIDRYVKNLLTDDDLKQLS